MKEDRKPPEAPEFMRFYMGVFQALSCTQHAHALTVHSNQLLACACCVQVPVLVLVARSFTSIAISGAKKPSGRIT